MSLLVVVGLARVPLRIDGEVCVEGSYQIWRGRGAGEFDLLIDI